MAGFIRKKFSQDIKPTNAPSNRQFDPVDHPHASSTPPLFTKFATGGQWKSNTNNPPRIVSSPMPLSNTSRRRVDLDPGSSSSARRGHGAANTQGSRDREVDPRIAYQGQTNKATPGRAMGPSSSSKPLPSDPSLTQHQPPRSNVDDSQFRQDTRSTLPPTPILRTPGVDKPLPVLAPADPSVVAPPTSYLSANRHTPGGGGGSRSTTSPPHLSDSGVSSSSSRSEKPLPQPSPTPPPPPRSNNKGKNREVDPPDPQQNARTENHFLPSLPVNHGPAYLLNQPKAPNLAKSLPSEPEIHSSVSTPNLIHTMLLTDSAPSARQAPSAPPTLNQPTPSSSSPFQPQNPSTSTLPLSDGPSHSSSSVPLSTSLRPSPTLAESNATDIPSLYPAGVIPDRNGNGLGYAPPPAVLGSTLNTLPYLSPDQSIPQAALATESNQGYDDILPGHSRTPNSQVPESSSAGRSAPGPFDQSAWLNLHADAFKNPDRKGARNSRSSSSNDLPTQSSAVMGASTSSLQLSPPAKARSGTGSKTRKSPTSPPITAETVGPKPTEQPFINQPQPQHPHPPPPPPPQPQPHRKSPSMRSVQRNAPIRGKPLIFAAMATVEQENEPAPSFVSPPPANNEFNAWGDMPPPSTHNGNTGQQVFGPPPMVQAKQNESNRQVLHRHASFNTDARPAGEGSVAKHPTMVRQPSKQGRTRKLSKSGHTSHLSSSDNLPSHTRGGSSNGNGNAYGGTPPRTPPGVEAHARSAASHYRTLTKLRPVSQVAPDMGAGRRPGEGTEDPMSSGSPLYDENDPFARSEGVKMLTPLCRDEPSANGLYLDTRVQQQQRPLPGDVNGFADVTDDYRHARSHRRGEMLEKAPPPEIGDVVAAVEEKEEEGEPPGAFPLVYYLCDATLLRSLLVYLTFYEWSVLWSVSREVRSLLQERVELREEVLERYMATVGYSQWRWSDSPEPISLSLQDLNEYMRGVSTPTHEYARIAETYLQASVSCGPGDPPMDLSLVEVVNRLTASTRAYTRVVLRLRAQAESEASAAGWDEAAKNGNGYTAPPQTWSHGGSSHGGSNRAPSPAQSMYSQSVHGHTLSRKHSNANSMFASQTANTGAGGGGGGYVTAVGGRGFRSPLFRVRRAPLLRVFVPSPGGDWLSDASVLQCEAELKNAGVLGMLRMGDVVWDVAVGDEGNVGRMVWDGSYLIDLDYTYSRVGDLPKYLPTLAFSPSYFHKVIRTGPAASNPIVHVDISPWGEEIAVNLQLLQDRIRTETPQGAYHNVVRWVHRSSFTIRPPSVPTHWYGGRRPVSPRLRIPGTNKLTIDPGWYGTIVVEAEGTNEGLADLQERCGRGAFPPRAGGVPIGGGGEARKVFRILRERSRPGEIWIRTVREKERIL